MNLGKLYIMTSNNIAPVASNVSITGDVIQGQVLTGNYDYYDRDGDAEGESTFRWLNCDTIDGSYSVIEYATSLTYTVQSSDVDKYIKFEVTPVAATGTIKTGEAIISSAVGPAESSIPYPATLSSTKLYVQNDSTTILDDGGNPADDQEVVTTWVGYVDSKNITQTTPAWKYKYVAAVPSINSLGNTTAKLMNLPTLSLDGSATKTLFIKFSLASINLNQALFNKEGVATYVFISSTNRLVFRLAASDIAMSSAGIMTTGDHILQIDISSSGTIAKLDSVEIVNDVDVFTMDLTGVWTIGRSDPAWNTISTDILAIGIFDETMTSEEKTNVYNHLLTL